jgi:transcriptional regulator with XRE-family HTH domain
MLNPEVKDAVPIVSYAAFHMETMGDRIKRLRVARGYTQEAFGRLVGVTKSAVSQWEDGSSKNVKLETFVRVLDVLHTDANYLIWGDSRAGPTEAPSPAGTRRFRPRPAGT